MLHEPRRNSSSRPLVTLLNRAMLFKPVIVGGQDITSLRALFDNNDRNVLVASQNQLLFFNIETGLQEAVVSILPSKLHPTESIVACEKFDTSLYLFTNLGKMFIWNLETKDWYNELTLPVEPKVENLISCKLLSKRQYIFASRDIATSEVRLYFSMSRSERDRPKQWDLIGECDSGRANSFDIGCYASQADLEKETKSNAEKFAKQRILVFTRKNQIHFQRLGIGEKLHLNISKQTISEHDFTCVRANPKRPMIAAGDSLGRIYIYTGGPDCESRPWSNRSKLHWHRRTVSELCFSSTGKTLYSVGDEPGCVVIWDLSGNNMGQKRVIANLGMPIRHISCGERSQKLLLSTEDNEILFMAADQSVKPIKTLTRRTYDMYLKNDFKAMRFNEPETSGDNQAIVPTVGLLLHPKTDSLVTNAKTGWLQFYSPKQRAKLESIDFLKSNILSLENGGHVVPSDITKAAFSSDGDWLALYETKDMGDLFPEVRLHIWQRSNTTEKWFWIQTADRLHSTAHISDLKFSPDGQYLVSVGEDGTFHVLHKICLDARSSSKQMYAKGFFGSVPEKMAALVAFSQDSSVLAISLKNETTLIWMIVDPYKLEYECQLSRVMNPPMNVDSANIADQDEIEVHSAVLGLHFGQHEPARSIAPLCEVRPKYIRIWNILNAQSDEMLEYHATTGLTQASANNQGGEDDNEDNNQTGAFTAVAFTQTQLDSSWVDHFAVSTENNLVYIFELKISPTSRRLEPIIVIDASLPQNNLRTFTSYSFMCFLNGPILDIDEHCHQDTLLLKLINRLCLMTDQQELVSFTDKLTLERQMAINSCNEIKTYELSELQNYLEKTSSLYKDEVKELSPTNESNGQSVTEKQKRIKRKLEVQRMLNNLFQRIPSHNLPRMDILGPMILDKLVVE